MMRFLQLGLWMKILQGLMIRMDDGLLVDQVVFPLFHTLDQGI